LYDINTIYHKTSLKIAFYKKNKKLPHMKYHQIDRNVFIKKQSQIHGANETNSVVVLTLMIFILYRQTVRCHLHSTATSLLKWADQEESIAISRCTL
jgi:hypothetical protein